MIGFKSEAESKNRYPGFSPAKEISEYRYDENIIFTGYITTEELLSAYDAATIYINSSDEDGEVFGIAVYEAASSGVPLCLPDYGTFDIFKDCALFHNNHDPHRLAENIKKYLNELNLKRINSDKAKNIARQFDYTIVKQQYKDFYEKFGFI